MNPAFFGWKKRRDDDDEVINADPEVMELGRRLAVKALLIATLLNLGAAVGILLFLRFGLGIRSPREFTDMMRTVLGAKDKEDDTQAHQLIDLTWFRRWARDLLAKSDEDVSCSDSIC